MAQKISLHKNGYGGNVMMLVVVAVVGRIGRSLYIVRIHCLHKLRRS